MALQSFLKIRFFGMKIFRKDCSAISFSFYGVRFNAEQFTKLPGGLQTDDEGRRINNFLIYK